MHCMATLSWPSCTSFIISKLPPATVCSIGNSNSVASLFKCLNASEMCHISLLIPVAPDYAFSVFLALTTVRIHVLYSALVCFQNAAPDFCFCHAECITFLLYLPSSTDIIICQTNERSHPHPSSKLHSVTVSVTGRPSLDKHLFKVCFQIAALISYCEIKLELAMFEIHNENQRVSQRETQRQRLRKTKKASDKNKETTKTTKTKQKRTGTQKVRHIFHHWLTYG